MTRAQRLALERTLNDRADFGRTCVPILGSGVNIQAAMQEGAKNRDDWSGLLRKVARETGAPRTLPSTPLAKWESLLRRWAAHKNVEPYEAEEKLQTFVCDELRAQERRTAHYSLYGEFLAAGFADIISLNFDRRVALHSRREKFEAPERRDTLYRRSIVDRTRIWYPHGDTRKSSTLRLGVRKYGTFIQLLESERMRIMAIRRHNDVPLPETRMLGFAYWLELILRGAPLVFIGCGLAADEWPLWWLLHQRARSSSARETYVLSVDGTTPSHLKGSPCGVEVIEFASHARMWDFVRAALRAPGR
jgi:hypothetical protein